MNDKIKAKREQLKAISAPFKILMKEGAIGSINEGLVNYYAEQGHTTLKSLNNWNNDGFKIKKGSEALLLWGQPKEFIKPKNESEEVKDKEQDETFFPLAYVFSNLQVEQRETQQMKR